MEMALTARVDKDHKRPALEGLPSDDESERAADSESDDNGSESSAGALQPGDRGDAPDQDICDSETDNRRADRFPEVRSALCGRLPVGVNPCDFLGRPCNVGKRNSAEGNYAKVETPFPASLEEQQGLRNKQ